MLRFLPVVHGRFEGSLSGTTVHVKMRFHVLTRLMLLNWYVVNALLLLVLLGMGVFLVVAHRRAKALELSADQAVRQAHADFDEARNIMFGLGALALVLGISIAYFVVKKIAAHTQTRQRLLLSLDSIAGFPEHNPIAVVELSPQQGVTYANVSAKNQFAGVEDKGLSHPVFTGLAQPAKNDG